MPAPSQVVYALIKNRALGKILSNAYKFIEGEGCVTVTVKDAPGCLPPQGCEDVSAAATRN